MNFAPLWSDDSRLFQMICTWQESITWPAQDYSNDLKTKQNKPKKLFWCDLSVKSSLLSLILILSLQLRGKWWNDFSHNQITLGTHRPGDYLTVGIWMNYAVEPLAKLLYHNNFHILDINIFFYYILHVERQIHFQSLSLSWTLPGVRTTQK